MSPFLVLLIGIVFLRNRETELGTSLKSQPQPNSPVDQPGGSQPLDGKTAHRVFPVKEVLDTYEELELLGQGLADLQVEDSVTGQGELIQVVLVLPAQETAFHTKLDRA